MEDEEETSLEVNESSPLGVEGSSLKEQLLGTEDLVNAEQCDFVSELEDSKLIGAEDGETVAEEEILMAGNEMETVTEVVMSGGSNYVPELDGTQLEAPIAPKEDKGNDAVAEAEISTVEMEPKEEVQAEVDKDGEEIVSMLHVSQFVGGQSLIAAKDDGDDESAVGMEEDISYWDTKMDLEPKVEVEMETGEGGEGEDVPELQDSRLLGGESLIEAKDDEAAEGEEIRTADTEIVSTEAEAEVAKGGGEFDPELDDSQLVGDVSPIVAEENGDEDEAMVAEEAEEEVAKGVGGESVPELDDSELVGDVSPIVAEEDEDETMVAEEEPPMVDTEMETEPEVAELVKLGGGKRKKGRNSKVPARAPPRKIIGEDVCFICFDGGDLVLCDRRGCSKAYHPSCVNRDEAFFRAKGRWNCGWHLCSKCEKNAYYMCYTCTFSLCKGCIKDAVILCVRGNKGFCETCMKTVMLIENAEQGNKEAQVDFDDKSSWEYLFKDYWIELKAKLCLSAVELTQAKNPWKGSDALAGKQESPDELFDVNDAGGSGSDNSSENLEASKSKRRKAKKRLNNAGGSGTDNSSEDLEASKSKRRKAKKQSNNAGGSGSDNSSENLEASKSKRRKAKKRSKSLTKKEDLTRQAVAVDAESISTPGNTEWASKQLVEFVMHMKNGDRSVLSQFDVQALLLEYIKTNKLRDPRRKSQIICDARLENLFGKARVGHFEMLKLIESHFLIKDDSQIDDIQGTVVDTEVNHLDADGNIEALTKGGKDRKRKMRKKVGGRGPQSNLDDYAAINIHNINLIYLRRKLMEDLLEDSEKFHDRIVGTFARIRISGSNQKQDIYRLVQVVGTSKTAEPYKVGKRTTDIMLEILNLNKTEAISIDTISNQEFTEDECKRLRQSIKCGLINRLTVGDILDKAMEIQAARVNDWLETEIMRLSHLRDRASEKGRRKELRECVEKLQLLKTPEERWRRIEEIPEIHADPNMDPSYESEDDDSEMDDNKQELYTRPRGSSFSRRGREPISPGSGDFSSKDSWSGARKSSSKNWELNRNLSNKDLLNKGEDGNLGFEILNDNLRNQGRHEDTQQSNNMEKPSSATSSETVGWKSHSGVRSESFSGVALETSPASRSTLVAETAAKISETDKMWHYQDPSGKVQGPFSMVQLRKWSNTGYFPVDLKIWNNTGMQGDSILLTDALAGKFQKQLPPVDNGYPKDITLQGREGQDGERLNFDQNRGAHTSHGNLVSSDPSSGGSLKSLPDPSSSRGWTSPLIEVPKLPTGTPGSDYGSRSDSINLPSPTPKQSSAGWTGEVGPLMGASSFPGGNGALQSPVAAIPDGGQFVRSSENSGFSATPNLEHGILVGSTNTLQTSQSTVAGESPGVQTHSHLLPVPETAANTVQSVNSQNPPFGTHGWGDAPSQNLEPNSSIHVHGQPQAYGHWIGVPSTVQNPAGNFSTQVVSTLPPNDPWRPPYPGNQLNMQPPAPPNVPWGMGIAANNTSAQGLRPDNPNTGWVTMPGNPNMGWGGPVPGNTNMNWGPIVQGPLPGHANPGWVVAPGNPGSVVQGPVPVNVNPGWVALPGNPGAMVQGLAPGNANQGWIPPTGNLGAAAGPVPGNGNPGWVAPTGNPGANAQGPAPGNGNPGWVAPTGNPGANAQGPVPGNGNPGWVAPTGNPGANVQGPAPGNANPGWGSPSGSRGMRGNEPHHNRDRFSGQRDRGSQGGGGRPWNRQSSFGSGGSGGSSKSLPKGPMVCKFHENGHCRKGSSCDFPHS